MKTTFKNITDFGKQTSGKRVFIELAGCGYFIPVTKVGINLVATAMMRHDKKAFAGTITPHDRNAVQVSIY